MKVSSVTGGPPLQEWADSAVPPMIRANEARLAQHSAERASGNWTPQELPFDGARRGGAKRARAFIYGQFRERVRMEDLCRATGVGIRTLQCCFRQCFGVNVTSYLKAVRLDAAYRDLIAAPLAGYRDDNRPTQWVQPPRTVLLRVSGALRATAEGDAEE